MSNYIIIFQQTLFMDSNLFGFLTPPKQHPPPNAHSTSRISRGSSHRKPIFTHDKPRDTLRHSILFNSNHASFQQQSVSASQVLNYDFCGCESQMTPCDIINQTLLKGVSIAEMKQSYMEVSQSESNLQLSTKRNLFQSLPKNYPELYFSHLHNICKLKQDLSPPEFICLAWIQYHSKVQYISYFLYQDLKRSFTNRSRFMEDLDYELGKIGTSYQKLASYFSERGFGNTFQLFLKDYFDSVSANLVPLTHYAKLIKIIFERGQKVLMKLILHFLNEHRAELSEGLKFLVHGEKERFRNYMRELNWEIYLDELQI